MTPEDRMRAYRKRWGLPAPAFIPDPEPLTHFGRLEEDFERHLHGKHIRDPYEQE